jgi:Phosphopantetheine attachment site
MGELGFDSLMALEFRNTLSRVLGVTSPATLILDHPIIESLAQLNSLSETEAEGLLSEKLSDRGN